MTVRSIFRRSGLAGLLMGLAPALSMAQPAAQPAPPSPSPGLPTNSNLPVKIESTTLEIRDKSRIATFSGNVKMTQGDAVVQCKVMIVYYEDSAPAPAGTKSTANKIAGPSGGQQQIKRV